MARNLLVVESPAKARTIKKYLGPDYDVLPSYGHVRDLRPKDGAVEPENGFRMHYEPIARNAKHVSALSRAMKKAKALYLATDPDREGEAISWHVTELLRDAQVLDAKPVCRVVFHEITKRAIDDAIANPREISTSLVNAQQARRALDYLVGFNLSPLLWKKIRKGLSAGRVQSPALRMIVEREEEIERFEKREYWTIEADLESGRVEFTAKLVRFGGDKVEQFTIKNEDQAEEWRKQLARSSSVEPAIGQAPGASHIAETAVGALCVHSVEKKQRRRNPPAPFITSTLQQEAGRKLGFTASRTMRVAQQLYEGVDTGDGAVGLITYMRTDSTTLATDAVAEVRAYIAREFGSGDVPRQPRAFRTSARNAQEAHEAIRPTSVERTPGSLAKSLARDQFRLYELIWKRTVACQMRHATIDTVAVELTCGANPWRGDSGSDAPVPATESKSDLSVPDDLFRATGSTVAVPGFLAVYQEGRDDRKDDKIAEQERRLPPLDKGDRVVLKALRPGQHFTEPPPRYSEASLIRALEDHGIGRPSTYAAIISTLQQREYAELQKRRFHPTDVGRLVNSFVTEHFADYVDYEFTARLEDDLDAVSRGERDWVPLLEQFWRPFRQTVSEKEANVTRTEASQPRKLGVDPESGRSVSVRVGRYGPYAQIGSAGEAEKPRFASLQPDQRVGAITLEEAIALFRLPRELGLTPDGDLVLTNIGRFGPYVKYGSKFASLGSDDDPYTIDLARALEIVAEKKRGDAQREIKEFEGSSIRILNGRYGPYLTDGKKNARVPKGRDPASIELDEAKRLIEAAPSRRPRRRRNS